VRYHRRLRVCAAAWSLAGFTLLELAAMMVLIVLNAGRVGTGRAISEVILAAAAGLYAGAGLLITRRFPATRFFTVLGSGTARTSMQTATGSGSTLVTPGSSLETLQPSASAQNRPTTESSRAFIAI
jgi:hypothetical protein